MKFGTTLRKSVYPPWKDKYVDYDKLKKLLKDNQDDDSWTNDDEEAFSNELATVQLEKVYGFVQEISQKLRDRTSACEKKLEPLAIGIQPEETGDAKDGNKSGSQGEGLFAPATEASKEPELSKADREKLLKDVLKELDGITKETKELEGFSRLNYTAIIKATKKHDKLRGASYKLRPFIDASLVRNPLQTEDASPLLYRLSALYSFVRQSLEGKSKESLSFSEGSTSADSFRSLKCTYTHWAMKVSLLTWCSLGSSRQSVRSQDRYPSPSPSPRVQPADIQDCRRQPARPNDHVYLL
jgi:SPX domain protein involved in polyphosphate accumulation